MNGKRTFWVSIIAGAVAGGLLSLLNKEARDYSKEIVRQTGVTLTHYTKNPDETVQIVKNSIHSINDIVSKNTDSALSALEQVEGTVNKFLK